jgi:hypothetical protein
MAPRWQAAWWPKMSRGGAMSGSEHGSTLTSSMVALGADHPHVGRGADRHQVRTVDVDSELASTGPPRPLVVGLHELGVRMVPTQDLAKYRQGLLVATEAEITSPFRRELAASRGTR